MRIGYFGGTFDPPHRAHLRVAQAAMHAFGLDRVLLAPTGVQPLKTEAPVAGFEDRLAMTRLLCADDPQLVASEIDAPRADGQPNFTIDALDRLRAELPGAQIFVIVGADSVATLPKWHAWERLIAEAEWVVVSRPGVDMDDAIDGLTLTAEQRAHIHPLTTLDEDISGTGVRERLRVGVACDRLLTPTVNLFIAKMHLYHAR